MPKFRKEAIRLFRRKPPSAGHLVIASAKVFQYVNVVFTEGKTCVTTLDEESRW